MVRMESFSGCASLGLMIAPRVGLLYTTVWANLSWRAVHMTAWVIHQMPFSSITKQAEHKNGTGCTVPNLTVAVLPDIATPSSGLLYAFGQVYNENYDSSDFLVMKIRYPSGIGAPIATSAPSATLRILSPSVLRRGEPVRLLAYRSGEYRLTLWDMTGRKVSDVYNGYLLEGTHCFAIDCLTTGTYMLMVQTKYGMEKKRVTVVK